MSFLESNNLLSDETIRRWEKFTSTNQLAHLSAEQSLMIQWLWEQSPFCARTCEKFPQLVTELLACSDANQGLGEQSYEHLLQTSVDEIKDEDEFKKNIRQFRNQALLKICWRDLVLQEDVFQILRSLSAVADACIRVSVDWIRLNLVQKYGEPLTEEGIPAHLVVIALGKLGGQELNFSSDIDVMFCYSGSGSTNGQKRISNQEFFISLAQKLIHCLSDITSDGFVYRVDCRLRPFGKSGPLAVNFNHLEDYYQAHGREWERYAFIKARVVYGTDKDREQFKTIASSFVYRKYIDFGVISTLREMKSLIAEQVKKIRHKNNIKLGSGGIREIEFIVQFFQLVNGGRNTRLQTCHIEQAIKEIERSGYLSEQDVKHITNAYIFLRLVENRLQMRNDEQTHILPDNAIIMAVLARSMNQLDATQFMGILCAHVNRVSSVFARISGDDTKGKGEDDSYARYWQQLTATDNEAENTSEIITFKDAEKIHAKLLDLVQSPAYRNQDLVGRQRLQTFMPLFLRRLQTVSSPALVMDRLYLLITKILRRSAYLVLLSESQSTMDQLIAVTYSSPWIATHLTAYPILLDELLVSSDEDYLFSKENIEQQFYDEVLRQTHMDYEHILEHVRQFKHARELRVACADVLEKLPIMKVSDQLSWTAEAIVSGCLQYLERDYEDSVTGDLAVIAFGKLGGIELSYGSDLDLVYIAQDESESSYPKDAKVPYFVKVARLAQRLTQMLTLQTISGTLYEVDTRLRPDGESGPIVAQLEYVHQYYKSRAWMWELQALIRARCIAGTENLKNQFAKIRSDIICQPRARGELAQQVVDMRDKMLKTKSSKSPEVFDIKNDKGGITDIEFMVQYMILANAHEDSGLCEYSDNVRLLERLATGGYLPDSIANELTEIYCNYRNMTHRLALQAQTTEIASNEYLKEREHVRTFWQQLLEVNIE